MFANLVKKVTFTCPVCNTSMKFDVPANLDGISDLFNAIDDLECPKCKESLSYDVRSMLDAIAKYNTAALKLIDIEKSTASKLD